jgi:type IV secretory pathway VirB10-like protein
MSKPAIVIMGALGVVALAVVLGAFALRDKRPPPAPIEEHEIVATTPPAPRLDAVPVNPAPPSPPAASPKEVVHRQQPAGKDAGPVLSEAALMAKLHDLAASDPPLSLQLAKEALARFPNSPEAPEFEWNLVKALANMDHYKEAKEAARVMVKKYPGNDFAADVDRHLLNHPPNPPNSPEPE